jgi:hypothetical protein
LLLNTQMSSTEADSQETKHLLGIESQRAHTRVQ